MRVTLGVLAAIAVAGVALAGGGEAVAQAGQMECRTTATGRQICEETFHSRMMREAREREVAAAASRSAAAASAAPAPVYSWRDVKPAPCSKLESLTSSGNYCEARQRAAARKAVGDTIAEGRCDEALKMALGAGDLDFAREVRDFCRAPAAP